MKADGRSGGSKQDEKMVRRAKGERGKRESTDWEELEVCPDETRRGIWSAQGREESHAGRPDEHTEADLGRAEVEGSGEGRGGGRRR